MSFTNPGSFLVGTDLSLTITNNQTGASVVLDGRLTRFTQKSEDHLEKITPIDNGGIPDHRFIANGWSGSIEVDRASDDFDSLFAAQESGFFLGANQPYYSIIVTVPNKKTGGLSRRVFIGVIFHQYDPGEYVKTTATKATIQWAATQRVIP